ncbi:MAG: TonB-dependent receptor [Pedobacter sp.]|nr:MAG: TonB-dependent receptor [Pedobacter sp.]
MNKKLPKLLGLMVLYLTCMSWASAVYARDNPKIEIRGTVKDSVGVLPGVSIKVKGTNMSASTDKNGKYILDVPDENAVLVFSMVGFVTQEIPVTGRNVIDVTLNESSNALDEIVITAFGGTTRRTDMIGSITSISTKNLKVPSSNLTTALAGQAAGIIAYQRSGEPGQDNADFFIRGITTFGTNTSPLILIDGMELTTTDLARLQPDDIASFSIFKDATSTAVYGARGANGVILVTTKQGAVGKAKLSFRIENSISQNTKDVEFADAVTYMTLSNEAILTRNPLGTTLYSPDKIASTAKGKNEFVYPANDWKEMMFRKSALTQRANLSVSGGGGVAKYFISGSLNRDNGMLKVDPRTNFNNNIDLKSYTLRSNTTIDVTSSTQIVVRLSGNFDDYTGPIDGGAGMYQKVMRSNPTLFPAYYPIDQQHSYVKHIMYGNYGDGSYLNPYADMTKGYKDYSRSLMLAQVEIKQDLSSVVKGLSFRTMFNTNRNNYFDISRFYEPYFYALSGYDQIGNTYNIANLNENSATEYLGYDEGTKQINTTFYMENVLNYNRVFKKHGVSAMLVNIMQERIAANAGDLQTSLPSRNAGLSGKATYSFDDRYFAEFDFGYNGSERFSEDQRYGFFPAGGIAWSISNEKFFKNLKGTINNLRLRATYGVIGNEAIGRSTDRFLYLSNVTLNDGGKSASFGNGQGAMFTLNGVTVSRYANRDITWERAYKKNIALEIGLWDRLNVNAEYYSEVRKDIFMNRSSIPVTVGLSAPVSANIGEATGSGVDLALDYSLPIKDGIGFTVRGNLTYATNKYLVFEEPAYAETYRSRVGNAIYQPYGYIAERLFIDDAEALNSPRQNFGEYGGGDIKYTDVNRDGQITEADRVPIGNPTLPEIIYGFGFSLNIKSWDINAFFQGLGNEAFFIDPAATTPFANYRSGSEMPGKTLNNQLLSAYANSHWSEDSRDVNALWPRLSPQVSANNSQTSTFFMRDGSFMRLKSVELGYSLPKKLMRKISASNFRLYLSGTNLLNFSNFDLWDVEMGGNGLGYPLQRVFNVGLNITFN